MKKPAKVRSLIKWLLLAMALASFFACRSSSSEEWNRRSEAKTEARILLIRAKESIIDSQTLDNHPDLSEFRVIDGVTYNDSQEVWNLSIGERSDEVSDEVAIVYEFLNVNKTREFGAIDFSGAIRRSSIGERDSFGSKAKAKHLETLPTDKVPVSTN